MSVQTVTFSQLESHLWESANILRGPVDAADFKTYIFPLLFFKRSCDVWDEEYDEIVDETGDADRALFPESPAVLSRTRMNVLAPICRAIHAKCQLALYGVGIASLAPEYVLPGAKG